MRLSVLVLVVDDEPDVEALFRQQFRRDLRAQRFVMDFATSAADALSRIADPIEQTCDRAADRCYRPLRSRWAGRLGFGARTQVSAAGRGLGIDPDAW